MRAEARAGIVARVYAETLLGTAEREGAVEEVSEGLGRVARAIDESDPFRRFLAGPQIAGDDKRAVVRSAFGERVHPLVLRFLELLIERRREPLIGEVHQAWSALLDARANRRSATVTTAIPADPGTVDAIRRALERATGQEIALEERVEPSLLGGLVVRTGDLVMDASLRSRLDVLRHRLRAAVAAGSTGAA
ncbi:MAG: ATP synthase F1 subunit delta [Gemmatimonadota bacterium]